MSEKQEINRWHWWRLPLCVLGIHRFTRQYYFRVYTPALIEKIKCCGCGKQKEEEEK